MSAVAAAIPVLLLLLYAASAVWSVVAFAGRRPQRRRLREALVGGTVAVHAVSIVLRAAQCRCCPLGTVPEALGVAAFALVAVYFCLEIRGGRRPTGILILPIAFLLALVSVVLRGDGADVNPALRNPWFSLHALAAVLAVAALAVSFVHGVFYLLLYREIKDHRFGRLFHRLPPLAVLARMTNLGALIGWALLSVTIAAGYIWGRMADRYAAMHADPLFLVTSGVWATYTVGVVIRFLGGWRGRVSVVLSVLAFGAFILVLTVASVAMPSIHELR